MNNTIQLNFSPIKITENAQAIITQIIKEQQENLNTDTVVLRYYILTGEEKIEAKLSLDTTINEDDTVIEFNSFTLVIDILSLNYLRGSLIDVDENKNLVIKDFDPSSFIAGSSCGSCGGGGGCCTI